MSNYKLGLMKESLEQRHVKKKSVEIIKKNILTKIIISAKNLNVKLLYNSWNFYREFLNVLLKT